MYTLAHVVATDVNGLIGLNNELPWGKIKVDLKYFKDLTMDSAVLMGVNTVCSLPRPDIGKKTLPGRFIIGVDKSSRGEGSPSFKARVDTFATDVTITKQYDAIRIPTRFCQDRIYIAGGGNIYAETMDDVRVVFRNVIHTKDPIVIKPDDKAVYYNLEKLRTDFIRIKSDFIGDNNASVLTEIWIRK